MSVDCARELKKHNVACVSLWPGGVQTELCMSAINDDNWETKVFSKNKKNQIKFWKFSETKETTEPKLQNKQKQQEFQIQTNLNYSTPSLRQK